MTTAYAGLLWGLAFVVLEALQYVFFGGVFQKISSFLFGFLVFGLTSVVFIGWTLVKRPSHLRIALQNPALLLAVNLTAAFAWIAYLGAVQLIEPAVAYTIGAGAMPCTAYVAYRMGVREGEPMRNGQELFGNLILLVAIVYLAVGTVAGLTGFVRGQTGFALLGVALAVADGVLFTWLLIYCQRMDKLGCAPGSVFGLRFPLYVLIAGMISWQIPENTLPASEITWIVAIGLVLIIPPLYALQRAVAEVSTLTISALTALGPFLIFGLQILEGRVNYSTFTFLGLAIYSVGAVIAAIGAVRANIEYK